MTAPPLTRRQQQIAHRYGLRCTIARCTSGATGHLKSSMYGATGYRVGSDEYWMDTTAKGIEIRSPGNTDRIITHNGRQFHYAGEPDDTITWAALARHVDALPETLRHRATRVDRLAHRTFPRHETAPGKTPKPFTQAEQDWSIERRRRIRRMEQAIYDAAFPLAVDDEPADLLDLIGDPA